jgi:hypothetical protein
VLQPIRFQCFGAWILERGFTPKFLHKRHMYVFVCVYRPTHARTHTRTHTHAHARAHTRTRAHARSHTHVHARTHTRTRTHARTNARTHTHARTHTVTTGAFYYLGLQEHDCDANRGVSVVQNNPAVLRKLGETTS